MADGNWGICGPDCPMYPNVPWLTDETLKVTHQNLDQEGIMIAVKPLLILASSLPLLGMMVTGLGISGFEVLEIIITLV